MTMTPIQAAVKAECFSWIGDDCPEGWELVGSIDLGDPADVNRALDKGLRIGSAYDGGSGLYSEPCQADVYQRKLAHAAGEMK